MLKVPISKVRTQAIMDNSSTIFGRIPISSIASVPLEGWRNCNTVSPALLGVYPVVFSVDSHGSLVNIHDFAFEKNFFYLILPVPQGD